MNKDELASVLKFIDQEFVSGAQKMTNNDRINRYKHWKNEVGDYRFDDVMEAVREQIKTGFPPKTGQIRAWLDEKACQKTTADGYYRLIKDNSGNIYYELKFPNAGGGRGLISAMEPWEHIKYRAVATKKPEHILAWDTVIKAKESGLDWEKQANNIFQQMIRTI